MSSERAFFFADGQAAESIQQLRDILLSHPNAAHHVSEERNDFANWVRHVHHDEQLARRLEKCRSTPQVVEVLDGYLAPATPHALERAPRHDLQTTPHPAAHEPQPAHEHTTQHVPERPPQTHHHAPERQTPPQEPEEPREPEVSDTDDLRGIESVLGITDEDRVEPVAEPSFAPSSAQATPPPEPVPEPPPPPPLMPPPVPEDLPRPTHDRKDFLLGMVAGLLLAVIVFIVIRLLS